MQPTAEEKRKYLELVDRYQRAHDVLKSRAKDVAEWSIAERLWSLPPGFDVEILTELISKAEHDDKIEDTGRRKARARLCVTTTITDPETGKPSKDTLWGHIVDLVNNDERDFVMRSLKQRAESIQVDIEALERDREIYSKMFAERGKRPLQLVFFWEKGRGE